MASILNLITVGGVIICEADNDPSLTATVQPNGDTLPVGSICFANVDGVGQGFIKTGAGDTAYKRIDLSENDWSLAGNLLSGASATSPNEYVGSNNDFDVVFKRNLTEAMRIQNGGLGNGLIFGTGTNALGEFERFNMSATRQLRSVTQAYNASGKTMLERHITASIQTTTASVTPILTFPTANNTGIMMILFVLVRGSVGGTVGNVSSYRRTVTARNVAGTLTIRQTNADQSYEDDGALNITATVTGASLLINAVGIASRTFDWFLSGTILTTT